MKTFPHSLVLSAALICSCLVASGQDREQGPDQLRRQAKELMEKARSLKVDGDAEGAEKLAAKAKELTSRAEKISRERERNVPGNENSDRRPPQPERERGDFQSPDRREPRPNLERRGPAQGFENEQRFDDNRPGNRPQPNRFSPGPGPDRPRPNQPVNPGPQRYRERPQFESQGDFGNDRNRRPTQSDRFDSRNQSFDNGPMPRNSARDNGNFDERRRHLEEAIKHLHAAGLHEPAERLAQQFNQRFQRMPNRREEPQMQRNQSRSPEPERRNQERER